MDGTQIDEGVSPEPPNAEFRRWLSHCIGSLTAAAAIDGAGISLCSMTGQREVLFASDDLAGRIEQLQFTLGEGPCVDSTRTGGTVLVPDIEDPRGGLAGRWPVFLQEVSKVGVRALFALPIQFGAIHLGAVDLYRLAPGPLSGKELGAAWTTVDAVALKVLQLWSSPSEGFQAEDPGWSTMTVHRAAGMAMVQIGTTIEEALLRLRATAYAEGKTINQVANEVVTGRRRFVEEKT